jgi:uncharacterized protein (DUF2384 family)
MQKLTKTKIKEGSKEAGAALLKALLRIGDHWHLSASTLASILKKDRSRIAEWQRNGEIPSNLHGATREALQNFFAIYRSLCAIFQNSEDQIKWLNTPHPDLDLKKEPIGLMQDSMKGLIEVRVYLDYVRGRGA